MTLQALAPYAFGWLLGTALYANLRDVLSDSPAAARLIYLVQLFISLGAIYAVSKILNK